MILVYRRGGHSLPASKLVGNAIGSEWGADPDGDYVDSWVGLEWRSRSHWNGDI